MRYTSNISYEDRPSKARYVYDKYKDILKDSILDVGADECHLKDMLPEGTQYVGVGMGGSPDIEVNLDTSPLPFDEDEFACVMCLDVLEHLESAHSVFDELCRVSKRYVLISLPNPYYDFIATLTDHRRAEKGRFKFYGLPDERPEDRHRWFFSSSDAKNFITHRAALNNFKIVQMDNEGEKASPSITSKIKRLIIKLIAAGLTVKASDLYERRTWALLEKNGS